MVVVRVGIEGVDMEFALPFIPGSNANVWGAPWSVQFGLHLTTFKVMLLKFHIYVKGMVSTLRNSVGGRVPL